MRGQHVRAFTHAALSPDPDLAVAALMIARLEYPKLDAGPYLDQLDTLGREARRRVQSAVPSGDSPMQVDPERYARIMSLNNYLFDELHFTGNDTHYEDPRNSFLNEVIERRTGIPITLSLLYMEVARRAGVHVEGVNFPGHFLVRSPARRDTGYSEDLLIDAHHGVALLSQEAGISRALARATKPQILVRMLLNLKRIYVQMHSFPQARDVTELLLAVNPSAREELRDRGLLASQLNDLSGALRDLQSYLQLSSGSELRGSARKEQEQIWEHVKTLRRRVASLN